MFYLQSILRERKLLESKRLDLDASKNRLKKAKTVLAQQAVSSNLSPLSEFSKITLGYLSGLPGKLKNSIFLWILLKLFSKILCFSVDVFKDLMVFFLIL